MKDIIPIEPEHLRTFDRVAVEMLVMSGLFDNRVLVSPEKFANPVSVPSGQVIGLVSRAFKFDEVVHVQRGQGYREARVLGASGNYVWVRWLNAPSDAEPHTAHLSDVRLDLPPVDAETPSVDAEPLTVDEEPRPVAAKTLPVD